MYFSVFLHKGTPSSSVFFYTLEPIQCSNFLHQGTYLVQCFSTQRNPSSSVSSAPRSPSSSVFFYSKEPVSLFLSLYIYIYRSIYLSVCLSIYPSIYLQDRKNNTNVSVIFRIQLFQTNKFTRQINFLNLSITD